LGGLAAVLGTLTSRLAQRQARRARCALAPGRACPRLRCSTLPAGLAFYVLPAGDASGGSAACEVPHTIVASIMIFGITTVWWMAPVYAAMSEHRCARTAVRRRWRSSTSA
jgi:hypothetical protein